MDNLLLHTTIPGPRPNKEWTTYKPKKRHPDWLFTLGYDFQNPQNTNTKFVL